MLSNDLMTRQSDLLPNAADEHGASPLAYLGQAILAVVSFKIFLSLFIGSQAYLDVVRDLAAGGLEQQIVAKFLMLDGLTLVVADAARSFIG